jgi:hypothetical protein
VLKIMLSVFISFGLCGCIMTPKKTTYYDYQCGETRVKLELNKEQKQLALGCNGGHTCLTQVVFLFAAGAVVSIVSGSIVLIGNSINWVEKKVTC